MIRSAAWALLFSIGALTAVRVARAETSGTAAASHVVRVFVAGDAKAVDQVRATLRELLGRLDLDVAVQAADDESALAGATDSVARVFVDLRSLSAPRVVVQNASNKDLERRVFPPASSLEVAAEESSHVAYMAIESALRAHDSSAAPAETPPPAPAAPPSQEKTGDASGGAPTAPKADSAPPLEPAKVTDRVVRTGSPSIELVTLPEPDRSGGDRGPRSSNGHERGKNATVGVELAAFGAVTSFDGVHAQPGIGAAVDVGAHFGKWRAGGRITGSAFFPEDVASSGESASLGAETLRLAAVFERSFSSRIAGVVALGGGVDRITLNPGASTPSVWTAGVDSRADPMLEGMAGAKFHVSPAFSAFAFASAEVDLAPHRYVLEVDGATRTFLRIATLHPLALIGLSFSFGGRAENLSEGDT